jgi:hypothetical protein
MDNAPEKRHYSPERKFDNHFIAISYVRWRTTSETRDIRELITMMESEKYPYYLWFVPLSADAPYEINGFAPEVEGAQLCGRFQPKTEDKGEQL